MANRGHRCPVCATPGRSCGPSDPSVRPVDIIEERGSAMKGTRKRYNVGGLDDGNGKTFPADTILNLSDDAAERMGLKKASRSADAGARPRRAGEGTAKRASTRKRAAPATRKRAAKRA